MTPSRSLPVSLKPTTCGRHHVERLAEHHRLGLDAAHAPAQHAEAVDHRGVGVGADQRVGEGDGLAALASRQHALAPGTRGSPGGRCRSRAARRGSWRTPSGPSAGTRSARGCARTRSRRCARARRAMPKTSTCTEWSIDQVHGHQRVDPLRVAARAASPRRASRRGPRRAGTPVKSCRITRAGMNGSSTSFGAAGVPGRRGSRTSSSVTSSPSQLRSTASSSTLIEKGSRSRPGARPAFSRALEPVDRGGRPQPVSRVARAPNASVFMAFLSAGRLRRAYTSARHRGRDGGLSGS